MKVEFGYDVLQVARGRYVSDDYHDFIGFDVSHELLSKTFREIYGMSLTELLRDYDTVIGTYRSTVTGLIPDAIKVAWELKKDELEKLAVTREKFFFRMPRAQFEKTYGIHYKRPSIFSKILAFLVRILPPIGPLKVLRFKPPTPEVETMFLKSFETTLADYNRILQNFSGDLPNKDLDTGKQTRLGEYRRADETYSKWLERLSGKKFATMDDPIKQNILNFYSIAPASPHVDKDDWKDIQQQLQKLKTMTTTEK